MELDKTPVTETETDRREPSKDRRKSQPTSHGNRPASGDPRRLGYDGPERRTALNAAPAPVWNAAADPAGACPMIAKQPRKAK